MIVTDNEITVKALKDLLEVMLCEGDLQRVSTVSHAIEHINRQKAEIERLTVNMNAFGLGMKLEKERADTARAEAIKEFVSMVKEHSYHNSYGDYIVDVDDIDNVMKEKVGE